MKGKKRIGLLALSLAFVGFASSCGSFAITRNTTPEKTEEAVTIEDTDRTELRTIVLDTSNARTTFYIGEEFSYDGLVVSRTLAVYDQNNKNKGTVNMPTKDFTVDASEVDMTKVGTYKVTVSHRLSNSILTQTYNVDVKSSVFESTPGLTYNAGLEVYYEDGKRIKEYLLHDTYVEKYKDDYDHNFDLNNLLNGLSIKLHKWTSNGKEATETRVMSLTPGQVEIDSSSVNIDQIGTYVIKVTYKADDIVIDGVNYNNDAVAFLIVNVSDPIESIKINSGNALFDQSIDGIDAEAAGWEVYVQPVVSDSYTEPFSYDKYQIDGVDIFKVNQPQDVTVSLISDPSVQCTKGIKITKSTTQDINSYVNLTPVINGYTTDDLPADILLAGTTFIHGPLPQKIDSDNYYTTGATYTSGRAGKDYSGSLAFDERITIKGSTQAFKIDFAKPGKLVVFFASSGDEERDLNLYGEDTTTHEMSSEAIQSATTTSVKQEIVRAIFDIPTAGSYYLANPLGGIYVHGFIIATDK